LATAPQGKVNASVRKMGMETILIAVNASKIAVNEWMKMSAPPESASSVLCVDTTT
jgi:hypothetical protein